MLKTEEFSERSMQNMHNLRGTTYVEITAVHAYRRGKTNFTGIVPQWCGLRAQPELPAVALGGSDLQCQAHPDQG
jgi:hypothetical protein